ncbi:peroxidase 5-like [Primulina huaijiensis]|uniref:peroxidase 5-like n=1 Tax=Primulina huaijiensis TaxID=1492673 RepID=UPI003CC718EA
MIDTKQVIFSGFLVVFCLYNVRTEAQLQVGFYRFSCPSAEGIVKDEVLKAFIQNNGVAAGLVRMHFHDCFVRGCDGSVLIDTVNPSSPAEKDSPPNNPSLRGFEVIDSAKARLEAVCARKVSCADILAFAARDSVEITRGLGYEVPAGRKDGRVSSSSEALANLPPPTSNVNQLTQAFANKGLTQEEMVTLSGSHTIGRSHCASFSNRLYNFNTTTSQDPTLDPNYANQLKAACPQGSTNPNLVVPMDPPSPATSDVSYYRGVLSNRGLFTSDQTLLTNQQTLSQVIQNSQNLFGWQIKFANAMVKMGKIGVLTGNNTGEIRVDCRVINS